jgi:hypothetical protein
MSNGISEVLSAFGSYSSQQRIVSATLLSGPGGSSFFDPLTNSNAFNARLEKHLDNVRKGRGYLTSGVDKDIAAKSYNSSSSLSSLNPNALRQYAGYLSGLSYDSKARFINGVSGGTQLLDKLTQINKTA